MHNEKVNKRSLVIAVMASAMLLAAALVSMPTTESAFAARHGRNQATAQANDCGNGDFPTNIGCQNTASQIQGDKNTVALAAQQTFPEEVTPSPGVEVCEECLASLTAFPGVAVDLAIDLGLALPIGVTDADAIAAICNALVNGTISFSDFVNSLAGFASIINGTQGEVVSCLAQAGFPGGAP
jgi:hypothetical protein